ncbi:nitroreductase family protein [Vitreoscilla massiliensis]|uniref:Nitroreductase family protein n=1 Tax=Vitreoscilla massiliensis TaxID=1689272 RepID=A0ABY4E776_9NEIS|nr:nitroreductase family protein [Vitreoscilla massiliensis]UOO91129.1 nitroreductase family protein [Vitreoscilla massiliensis]
MHHSIQHLIETRTSINHFQPNRPLQEDEMITLVDLATKAPTAYNMQNWRFIAAQSEEAKTRLKAAAFGQQKIVDASIAFIICGKLAEHQQLHKTLQASVNAHIIEQHVADAWVLQAASAHESNEQLQRDEAMRSASLAAMTLMLAAQDMGLASCAIGGFDAIEVARQFSLAPNELPALVVVVGYPAAHNWQQKIRKPLKEILTVI